MHRRTPDVQTGPNYEHVYAKKQLITKKAKLLLIATQDMPSCLFFDLSSDE